MALSNLIPKSFPMVSHKKTESNGVFPFPILAALFLLLSLLTSGHSQKLQVIQVSDPVEDFTVSPPAGYYGKKQLDIIWNITYSAEVKIDLFDIDFQAGEFVIVCEYPLPNDYRLSDGAPAEDALYLLPVQNSLLLTSDIVPDKPVQDEDDDSDGDGDGDEGVQRPLTVRINSIYGGFIYFHGVSDVTAFETSDKLSVGPRSAASDISGSSSTNSTDPDMESVSAQESVAVIVPVPTDAKANVEITGNNVAANGGEVELKGKALPTPLALSFDGFKMVVQYLELDPAPITTTTTERLTTPAPGVDIYLYRYVIGKSPSDFYDGLTEFKEVMAEMGNHYCNIQNCSLIRDIVSDNKTDDIRLDKNTIFFCDRRSENYNKCVQIKMAIPIRNTQNQYVMNTTILEDMWDNHAAKFLRNISVGDNNETLKPYYPADEEDPINTWIWMAAISGVILLLVAITVVSQLTTVCEKRVSRDKPSERPILPGEKESPPSTQGRKNLILKVMDDLRKGMQEAEYHGMGPVEHEVATRTKESFNQSHGYGQYGQSPGFDNFSFNQDEGFQDYRAGSSGSDGPPNIPNTNSQIPFPAITRPYNNNQRTNQNPDLSRNSPSHHTFEAQIHHAVDDDSDEEEIYNQRRPRQ